MGLFTGIVEKKCGIGARKKSVFSGGLLMGAATPAPQEIEEEAVGIYLAFTLVKETIDFVKRDFVFSFHDYNSSNNYSTDF